MCTAAEGLAAFLCGVGACTLIALFFLWLLRPAQAEQLWTVLPGRGDGGALECTLQWLSWLRRAGLFQGEAVIWDADLTPEGRGLALRLTLRWSWVTLRPRGSLEEWMETESR